MAMMASGPGDSPYDQHDTVIEQDLLEDGKPSRVACRLLL